MGTFNVLNLKRKKEVDKVDGIPKQMVVGRWSKTQEVKFQANKAKFPCRCQMW